MQAVLRFIDRQKRRRARTEQRIGLTSHSAELAELIAAGAPCQRYALENRGGETRIVE